MKLETLKAKIDVKSADLADLLEKSESVEEIKALTDELNGLKADYEAKSQAEAAMKPVNAAAVEVKNTKLEGAFAGILDGKSITVSLNDHTDFELKTLVATTAGFPAPKIATPFTFLGSNPGHALFDAAEKFKMNSVSEVYYVQNTRTNNAGIGTEGFAQTDNVDSFDEVVVTAKPVISWIPVSEAVLRSLQQDNLNVIMTDVVRMAKQRVDSEVLTGTNISRSLNTVVGAANTGTFGFLNTVYSAGIGTQPLAYRQAIDFAAAQIEADGDIPAYVVVNPKSAAKMVNERDGQIVNGGAYAWTAQSDWTTYNGLRLIKDANVAENTAWVLGAQGLRIGMLDEATLEMGYNAADFTSGRKSLRCLMHVGILCRPLSIFRLTLTA